MEREAPLERFDRLLKAMTEGEPHKAEKRSQEPEKNKPRPDESDRG